MTKPKILVMSDNSSLHTGFATVSRNILNYLYDTGKYEIRELGWFSPPKNFTAKENLPRWQVYTTDRSNRVSHDQDKYGQYSLPKVIAHFEPDVLLTIGDEWMVNHAGLHRNKWNYIWVSYVPIDSQPILPSWVDTFVSADIFVAYCNWGKEAIRQRKPDFDCRWIWHGVDTEVFKPFPLEQRIEFKKKMGLKGDEFLVSEVARNQPRKHVPILFKAFSLLAHQKRKCLDTGKSYISDPQKVYMNALIFAPREIRFLSETRKDNTISPFTGGKTEEDIFLSKDQCRLYLHMAFNDVGWDLMEQIGRYRLEDYVVYNPSLQVGKGVSTEELAGIYNATDVMALPTSAEGFGLPILETMSCGTTQLVTDYSAHTDFAREGGPMIDVGVLFTEPRSNMERALADNYDLYNKLRRLYEHPEEREVWGKRGRAMAEKMDWKKCICPQWEKVVDEAIIMQKNEPYHKIMEPAGNGVDIV